MVGFDVTDGGHRRAGIDGNAARTATTPGNATVDETTADSSRRLSRELEEGFRDDSGSEHSEQEVTVGRRMSRSHWDRLRTAYA